MRGDAGSPADSEEALDGKDFFQKGAPDGALHARTPEKANLRCPLPMKALTKFFIDLLLWLAAAPSALWFRVDSEWMAFLPQLGIYMLAGLPLKAAGVYLMGLHRRSWHRVCVRDLIALSGVVTALALLLFSFTQFLPTEMRVPRSVPFIEGMTAMLIMGTVRLGARLIAERRGWLRAYRSKRIRRILIAGAGEAGTLLAREMLRHPNSGQTPIGFLDDDPSKRRQRFLGLKVLGEFGDLEEVVNRHEVDEVLIAVPSAGGRVVRRIVDQATEAKVAYRIIPGIFEVLNGSVSVSQIREVDVTDLLHRKPVVLDTAGIAGYLNQKVVLVTGAGGSIGSEIVRQIAHYCPRQIVLLGRGENSIFSIHHKLLGMGTEADHFPVIVDVRDRASLSHIFRRFRPNVVFHAAAHKHVPLMEANPDQAVLNNVVGTRNVVELALEYDVERLVNVSSDKAVNPTSIMGATKRVAELVVYRASQHCTSDQAFVSVRFGNVLGSRGSVVPVFKEQIRRGGPVTLTHPDMMRYFMTIPEASQLVLQAGGIARNGSVYVLDMGEPVRIADLAVDLIRLSGLTPYEDIDIVYTGCRPGEKLFEELLTAEEGTFSSQHDQIFVARRNGLPEGEDFEALCEELIEAAVGSDEDGVRNGLQRIIPTCQFSALMVLGGDGASQVVSVRA